MDNRRYLIYCDMMTELKLTNQLMNEYDSLPHDYGNAVLYQSCLLYTSDAADE